MRALEPLAVKGRAGPGAAFEVLGPRTGGAAARPAMGLQRTRVRGRAAERAAAIGACERTLASGAPAMVLVTGPVGIGKTSLMRDARFETARTHTIGRLLTARCHADASAGAFEVLAELLRGAAGVPAGETGRAAAERVAGYLRAAFGAGPGGGGDHVVTAPGELDEIVRLLSRAIGLSDVPLGAPAAARDPQTPHRAPLEAVRRGPGALARGGPVPPRRADLQWAPGGRAVRGRPPSAPRN